MSRRKGLSLGYRTMKRAGCSNQSLVLALRASGERDQYLLEADMSSDGYRRSLLAGSARRAHKRYLKHMRIWENKP